MARVILTSMEMMQAAHVGVMRRVLSLKEGYREAYDLSPNGPVWDHNVEGACGEFAAAKALGAFWSAACGIVGGPDLGGCLQVRTRSQPTYDLILHDRDPDDAPFVLVVGRAPTYDVVGWIRGRDGKRPEYWKDPAGGRPAYFVPQKKLEPLTTLDPKE